jgi:ABC-type phosphate transport system substrate-binding protein
MRTIITTTFGACVVGALALSTAGSALADPPAGVTPAANSIVGVGSDTTEFVLDELALGYDSQSPAPAAKLYSWDATGSTPIKTKTGATTIPRPNGSSAGITALINNTQATVDYARSSRKRKSTDPTSISFVAFAKDAVTIAVQTTTNAPASLTTAQLAAIYKCTSRTWNTVGGTSTATIKPFLPQSGSGTRAFFETAIGITDAQVGSCVNSTVQENEGTNALLKDPNAIVPYSVAKFIAQVFHSGPGQNKFGTDQHGTLKLNKINGLAPTTGTGTSTTINPLFSAAFIRTVFNVVRTATTTDHIPAYEEVIFGTHGYICLHPTTVKNYGFLALSGSQCGAVS